MVSPHRISTPAGPVTGLRSSTAFGEQLVFKGVTYARAHRGVPPEQVLALSGRVTSTIRDQTVAGGFDATEYRAQCPQNPGSLERLLGAGTLAMDEDCLHLNVFTPAVDGRPRPVLVWVHGGAFVNGTGAMAWYHGGRLATAGDAVVVTCNYRLGGFGFLGSDDLGLADQLTVLAWVQRNIEAYGGDPDRVTVFGESAGGTSVLCLKALTAGTGMAHRFWAMSPSITQIRGIERATEAATRFRALSPRDPAGLTSEEFLAVQAQVEADRAEALTAFAPTAGGTLLPGPDPADTLSAIATDDRPLVIGTTRDEMLVFTAFDPVNGALTDDGLTEHLGRRYGDHGAALLDAYRRHRPGASPGALLSAVQTDETFRVTARRVAEAATPGSVWSYWFCQASEAFDGLLGACHGLDIPYAFDNLERPGASMFTGAQPETLAAHQAVATEFSRRILDFAHTGTPDWEPYDTARRATLQIGGRIDSAPGRVSAVVEDPEPELRVLWDALTPPEGR